MIKNTPPAIYTRLKKQFGVSWKDGVIITYYPNIYWVGGDKLPQEKVVHENVHLEQQRTYPGGPEAWWNEYLSQVTFRLKEETEAYQAEADYIRKIVLDRNQQFKFINQMAKDLSGFIYGHIISYSDAMALLK